VSEQQRDERDGILGGAVQRLVAETPRLLDEIALNQRKLADVITAIADGMTALDSSLFRLTATMMGILADALDALGYAFRALSAPAVPGTRLLGA
jgi:hypothetical protein